MMHLGVGATGPGPWAWFETPESYDRRISQSRTVRPS